MNAAECGQLGEKRLEPPQNYLNSGQYFNLAGAGEEKCVPASCMWHPGSSSSPAGSTSPCTRTCLAFRAPFHYIPK